MIAAAVEQTANTAPAGVVVGVVFGLVALVLALGYLASRGASS